MSELVLKKKNLPKGWIGCKLENVTQKVLKIDPKEYPDKKFQYCDIASINNNELKIISPKIFFGRDAPSRARQLIHVNDILFSTVRTYLHNMGIVPLELDNQLASTGFCVLRSNNLIINCLIFYLIQTVQFEQYLNPLQRGTSYPAVRNDDIINYVFKLPPLNEQKRIVAKIESILVQIDAGREKLDNVKKLLKQNKQSILKQAFEGKLVPQDPNDESSKILLKKIHVDSKLKFEKEDNHPKGWIGCKLENVTQKVLKIDPKEYPDKKFQYCDIASINNNELKIISPKIFFGRDAPSRARQLIHVNDILFSTVRTYLHNMGIVPLELDNQLASTGFCVLRSNNLIINCLIFYLIQTVQFEQYLNPLQRGTSYPAVRNDDIINYVFKLPPLNEQKRIVAKIESIFGRIDAIEKQVDDSLTKLDQLKKSTLKKAFEGKLVPQDSSDEPAEILLQKIKQQKEQLIQNQKPSKRKKIVK